MTYSFESLSPADFEDLSRDLVGRELGVRFEAFGPGPDGGIDGRHAAAGETMILQAKHYRLSDLAALARVMKRERAAIDALQPDRYLLTTSRPLLPDNKAALAEIIGPALAATSDILGSEDLNGLLRKHPEVERSHVKLWLSESAVLERVLHAASHNYTTLTRAEIEAKLRVYAENPSFNAGRDILESQRVLIVSGSPGVGKTTLAEMLCYAYLGEEWELVAIRNLDEGFARIDDAKRQVFFFDDFLGRIALDERALSTQDSEFARFISRVRRTPSARFILTTRAYIYEQARLLSEALSDKKLKVARYVLDVGVYTRRIRARILYNHLIVAGVPEAYIQALIASGAIKEIVDHDHYNPRIVQWMTEPDRIGDTAAADYPAEFIHALDDPDRIWDKAFRTHIARRCQHLLLALFLGPEHGADIEDVREIFEGIHPVLCREYGIASDPKDFEEALRTVEGSFVSIANGMAWYINPSVRDYLSGYLADKPLLMVLAEGVPTLRAARNLYDHFMKQSAHTNESIAAFTRKLLPLCERARTVRPWKFIPGDPSTSRWYELSNSDRIELFVTWWRLSGEAEFLAIAQVIAARGGGAFSAWEDGRNLPEILAGLRATLNEGPGVAPPDSLVESVEEALSSLIQSDLDPDDIERIQSSALAHESSLPASVFTEIDAAIHQMIDNLPRNLDHVDSESTLEDYTQTVTKLGAQVGADPAAILRATAAIESRIARLKDDEPEDTDLSVTGNLDSERDVFDDEALANLFAPLAVSQE